MRKASLDIELRLRVDVECFEHHPITNQPINAIRAFRVAEALSGMLPNVTQMIRAAQDTLEIACFKIYKTQTKDEIIFSWNPSMQEHLNRQAAAKKQVTRIKQKVIEMIPTQDGGNGQTVYASEEECS